ncbi:hypothetical protein CALVIDRAFT_597830 [Calocera viscosa TUFC12733]|uniref:Transmembrane protein n=1 Tax=Calocera viscosa (strain TUFC12733) TaxID=1330018 RepID=A0A167MVW7_CALVF|nr:hypothetical protein CALVIDRAFT_597830 [Calocera viscosa TUFC12733]
MSRIHGLLLACVLALLVCLQPIAASPVRQLDANLWHRQAPTSATLPDIFKSATPAPTSTSSRSSTTSSTSSTSSRTSSSTSSSATSTNSQTSSSTTLSMRSTTSIPTANPTEVDFVGADDTVSDLFVPGTRFFPLGVVVICLIALVVLAIFLILFVICSRRRARSIPTTKDISRPIPPQTPHFVEKTLNRRTRSSVIIIGPAFTLFSHKRKSSALPALPLSAKALSFSSFGTTDSSALPTPNAPVTARPDSTSDLPKHASHTSGLFSAGPASVWDVQSLAYAPDSTISRVPPTPLPSSFPIITPIEIKSSYIEQLETPVQGPSMAAALPIFQAVSSPSRTSPIRTESLQPGKPQLTRLAIPEPILMPKRRTPVVAVRPNLERLEEEESEPERTPMWHGGSPPRPLPKIPAPPPPPQGPLPPPPGWT